MNEDMKKLVKDQIQVLSERSKEDGITVSDLVLLSDSMSRLANLVCNFCNQ